MLLHPARAQGMEADREKEGRGQILDPVRAAPKENGRVERDAGHQIGPTPSAPHPDRPQPRGPRNLEKWKQEFPKRLAQERIADHPRLPPFGQVGILLVVALVAGMLRMVNPKSGASGESARR